MTLPDDTLVYPGHDYRGHTHTTVGAERAGKPGCSSTRRRSSPTP